MISVNQGGLFFKSFLIASCVSRAVPEIVVFI